MEADDLVSKVGIKAHARPIGRINTALSQSGGETNPRAIGILVKKPKRNEASPEIAAVAVIKSLLTPKPLLESHTIMNL
jgi:hypothetical protein